MGKPYKVSLVRCAEYDVNRIIDAMRLALAHIDYDLSSLTNKTVLLKPNMLGAYAPSRHITTHPVFVEAAARLFKDCGARVMIGDSHSGVYRTPDVWRVTGLAQAARRAGAKIVPFEKSGSLRMGKITLAKSAFDADIMINLPKLKTHIFTALTCAAKNLYGCVPGRLKSFYHAKYADRLALPEVIAKIAARIAPALTIVDAITGMHGEGPTGGDPVDLGLILAGNDVNAVDAVCCRLAGLKPSTLSTLSKAHELGSYDLKATVILRGESIKSCRPPSFALPSTFRPRLLDASVSRLIREREHRSRSMQPVISDQRCQRCGLCLKSCPVGAITWRNKRSGAAPRIDERACIQCFCCHETCPHRAINLKE